MIASAASGKAAPIGAGTFGQLVGIALTAAAGDRIKFEFVEIATPTWLARVAA